MAGIDDIHRRLGKDAIGERLEIVLLREWTTRFEMSIVRSARREPELGAPSAFLWLKQGGFTRVISSRRP